MSFELVNTSVAKGLKPGSRGFTTVAFTEGMPANYVQLCESLSGYVHVFGLEDPRYGQNPPAYSHLVSTVGGRTFSILSRVSSYDADYTGRSNKLAHHLMIKVEERKECGPAVVMDGGKIFFNKWKEEPKHLPENRVTLKEIQIVPRAPQKVNEIGLRATQWEMTFGDAGAAGVLAQAFLDAPDRPSFIIFQSGMDLLPLIAEAQALLPEERRWDVTFSTYFTALPVGMKCAWRCCLPESDALVTARRTPGALVINLIDKKPIEGTLPTDKTLAEVARTGNPKAPIAEITTPSPLPIIAAPVPSMPPQKAAVASPRISLDLGKALKPEPPTQGRKRPQKKQSQFTLVRTTIVVIVLVLCGFAAFLVRQYLDREKTNSVVEKTKSVETAQADETSAQTVDEAVVKSPEPGVATSPTLLDDQAELNLVPAPEATPPVKAIIFGHNEEGKSYAAPVSIIFWDVNAVLLTNAPATNTMDGGIRYGSYARHQSGRFSSIPASVAFFRAEYAAEQVVLFVRPVQAKFLPDSTNLIFPPSDGGEILKSWIGKCTNSVSAILFRGDAGFKAEVPDRETMHIVLRPEEIDQWKLPEKKEEIKIDGLQQLQSKLSRATNDIQNVELFLARINENATKNGDGNNRAAQDKSEEQAKRAYAKYMQSVADLVARYDGLAKDVNQGRSESSGKLSILKGQKKLLSEEDTIKQSMWTVQSTAGEFSSLLSQLAQDLQGGANIQIRIEQAENDLRRVQSLSLPTKAEIMFEGRPIVEATIK